MQTLDVLDDNARFLNQPKVRFWSSQFSSNVTSPQLTFDVVVGVIAPILCYIFDPIVFNNNFGLAPFQLARYKLFVYLFSALSIVTLSLFLTKRIKSGPLNAIIAGILLSGALCALIIGIIILPLSVLGLIFFLIGILGFTPFLTAFVYLRNAVRAVKKAKPLVIPMKEKSKKSSDEYQRFEQLAKQLISVPKSEIDKREAEYQRAKKSAKKRKTA